MKIRALMVVCLAWIVAVTVQGAEVWEPTAGSSIETQSVRIVKQGMEHCREDEGAVRSIGTLNRYRVVTNDIGMLGPFVAKDDRQMFHDYDVDADGVSSNDTVWAHEFSMTNPLTPDMPFYDVSVGSQRHYGGLSIYTVDTTDPNGFSEAGMNGGEEGNHYQPRRNWSYFNESFAIYNPYQAYGVWVWKKDDFLNGGADCPVSFDSNSVLAHLVMRYYMGMEGFRWVVRNNDQFYISEAIYQYADETPGKNGGKVHQICPLDTQWAEYNPGSPSAHLIHFDTNSASYANRTFTNVTGVGCYLFKDELIPGYLGHKWYSFDAHAVVQRPVRPSESIDMVEVAGSGGVQDFYLSTCEVPYELWRKVYRLANHNVFCLDPRGAAFDNDGDMGSMDYPDTNGVYSSHGRNEPVTDVTLPDVIAWCNALSIQESREPVYYEDSSFSNIFLEVKYSPHWLDAPTNLPTVYVKWDADGYRLPTPKEWERAHTAGSQQYSATYGRIDSNSTGTTHAVGGLTTNALGIYDMAGNVWEQTWPFGDQIDLASSSNQLVVGGDLHHPINPTNYSASAYGDKPYDGNYNIGFRLVRREAGLSDPDTATTITNAIPQWPIAESDQNLADTNRQFSEPLSSDWLAIKSAPGTNFSMGLFEVTFAEWQPVYDWAVEQGYEFDYDGDLGSMAYWGWGTNAAPETHGPNEPVTGMNHFDVILWLNALSELEGLTPVYCLDTSFTQVISNSFIYRPMMMTLGEGADADTAKNDEILAWPIYHLDSTADGYRLPYEPELQYVAEAGSVSNKYPWTDDEDLSYLGTNYAWILDNSGLTTHPVGQKETNAWGFFDMVGNANELSETTGAGMYGEYSMRFGLGFFDLVEGYPRTPSHRGIHDGLCYPDVGFRVLRQDSQPQASLWNFDEPFETLLVSEDMLPDFDSLRLVADLDLDFDPTDFDNLVGKVHRGDLGRSGVFNATGVTTAPSERWKFQTGGPVKSSPVVVNDIAYFGSWDGFVYAVDVTDGSCIWSNQTGDKVSGSAAVVSNAVFIAGENGTLYSFNALTGATNWAATVTNGSGMAGSPAVAYGTVFIAAGSGGGAEDLHGSAKKIYGFDMATGGEVWISDDDGPQGFAALALDATNMYTHLNGSTKCLSIDLKTGSRNWNSVLGGQNRQFMSASVVDGNVYTPGSVWGTVSRHVLESGVTNWLTKTLPGNLTLTFGGKFGYGVFTDLAIAHGLVYAGCDNGKLYTFEQDTGVTNWSFQTDNKVQSSPAIAGDLVYFADWGGIVYAVNATNGTNVWSYDLGERTVSAAWPADGALYIGCDDGALYCLEEDSIRIVLSTSSLSVPEGSTNTFDVKLNSNPGTLTTVNVSRVSGGDEDISVTGGATLIFTTNTWNTNQTVTLTAAQDNGDWSNGVAYIDCTSTGLATQTLMATEIDDETDPAYAIPWQETFENDGNNAGTPGALSGQHGWTTSGSGSALVQNSTVQSGSQALSITNATASHTFAGSPTHIWATFWAQPVRGAAPATIAGGASAVFYVNTNDLIVAYDATTATEISGATVSNGWNKFTVFGDYVSKVWNLELNDTLVVSNFAFHGAPTNFSAFEWIEATTNKLYVDTIDITDTQSAGNPVDIIVSTNALSVLEESTNTFGVKLSADPLTSLAVNVTRLGGDDSITVSGGATLNFNSGNWSSNLFVTLSAANDPDIVAGVTTVRCSAASADSVDVVATEVDDDTLQMVLSTTALSVPEESTNTFGIRLNGDPQNSVTVSVDHVFGDSSIIVSNGASLVFDSGTWNVDQFVTLSAEDDLDETNGRALIDCTSPGMITQTVTATESDNDLVIPDVLPDDWPEFGGNAERTATTEQMLSFPLTNVWVYDTGHAPSPAYREGVSQHSDNFNSETIKFDYAYHPVIANGRLFFGSSTEDLVTCLDSESGATNWVFRTEGAVRVAPSVVSNRIYFGSDDGKAYCLDVADGSEAWSFNAALGERWIPGNDRMMSLWPVRTGISVKDGVAYFAAGALSEDGNRLYARDAATGDSVWQTNTDFTANGPILIETNSTMCGVSLIVPSGRNSPPEYDLDDGSTYMTKMNRRIGGGASVWKFDNMTAFGPNEFGYIEIRVADDGTDNNDQAFNGLITHVDGIQLLCNSNRTFRLDKDELCAYSTSEFNTELTNSVADGNPYVVNHTSRPRANTEVPKLDVYLDRWVQADSNKAWTVSLMDARTMIRSGDSLFVGTTDEVKAYSTLTGSNLWSAAVTGEVWALAVANSNLYASTDQGIIYCFKSSGSFADQSPTFSNPYTSNSVIEEAASLIAQEAENTNGYCLVLGAGADDGRLAYEIAKQTGFFVIGTEADSNKVASARAKLSQAGVYGSRVVIHQMTGDRYPYTDLFANVIVAADAVDSGSTPYAPNEILRMLRPYGGLILMGNGSGGALDLDSWQHGEFSGWSTLGSSAGAWWRKATRGAMTGAGEWSHHYGNLENTSCSDDQLVSDTNLVTQWFGAPGPEDVINRHDMGMPPLFKNGYLLVSGREDSFKLLDPYNGTERWKITIPSSIRMRMPLANAFMCMDDDYLYAATSNKCRIINLVDGSTADTYSVPNSSNDWGFIATDGARLYGSIQKSAASYNSFYDINELINKFTDTARPIVSTSLFALNPTNGNTLWEYTNSSVIINSSIAISDSKIFFVESTASAAVDDTDGCVDLNDFYATGARMVAVDITDGYVAWSEPMSAAPDATYEHIAYLSVHSNVLLCTRGYITQDSGVDHATYQFTGIDPDTHTNLWQKTRVSPEEWKDALKGTKSQAFAHPTIMNGRFYHLAYKNGGIMYAFDVQDGTDYSDTGFGTAWESKGCAMRPASSTTMYHRHTTTEAYNTTSQEKSYISTVDRPSCWMSVIPAGGLVLMPEGGSGCDCGITLQLSMAKAAPVVDTSAPGLSSASVTNDTHIIITFSEGVDQTTAENTSNYSISGGITVSAASRMANHPDRVELTVSFMADGTYTATVQNVEDIYGNAMSSDNVAFDVTVYADNSLRILSTVSELTVPENSTNTFSVRLSEAPVSGSETVTVFRFSGDTNITVQSGSNLVFNTTTWSNWQPVVLFAAADDDSISDSALIRCTAPGRSTNDVTATENDDDTPQEPSADVRVLFDFGEPGGITTGNWNNITSAATLGTIVANAVDENGDDTTINLSMTNGFDRTQDDGTAVAGLYPVSAKYDGFRINGTTPTAALKLSGLALNTTCDLTFFASDNAACDTRYIATGASVVTGVLTEAEIEGPNETNTVTLTVRPDANGEIVIDIDRNGAGSGEGHLGVLDVTMTSDPISILVSSSDVAVPENSTSTFGIKLSENPGISWIVATDVVVGGDPDITVTSTSPRTFTTNDWNVYQWVTLSASNDDDLVSGVTTVRCSTAEADDVDVVATEVDDDSLQIILSTNALTVAEGSSNTFDLKLNGYSGTLTTVSVINAVGGDDSISVTDGSSLVFNSGDWSSNKTVTLSADTDPDWSNGVATIECSVAGVTTQSLTATEADSDTDPDYGLPWSETFENDGNNAGTLGALNGQHGWVADAGALVQSDTVHNGAQALALTNATASHTFLGSPTNVWATFWAQPVPGIAPVTIASNASAVFYVSTNDLIVAYDTTNAIEIAGATVSNGWNKFEIYSDYSAGIWSLELNDTLVVSNFDFHGAPANFSVLEMIGVSTNKLYVDTLHISDTPEAPEIMVSTTALDVPEGSTNTFGVKLASNPGGDWAVTTARVGGDTNITVSIGATLTFTTINWSTNQWVTLSASADTDPISGVATVRCSAAGTDAIDVIATEADTNTVGITMVQIQDQVLVSNTIPFGINASRGHTDNIYDPPMLKTNEVLNFEGVSYRQCIQGHIFADGFGTKQTTLSLATSHNWMSVYTGANVRVLSGDGFGQTTTVVGVYNKTYSWEGEIVTNLFFEFADTLTLTGGETNNAIMIEKYDRSGFVGGDDTTWNGTHTRIVTNDTPPGVWGNAALCIDGTQGPDQYQLKGCWQRFRDANGTWRITFWAKNYSGTPDFSISAVPSGFATTNITLTNIWQQYTVDLDVSGVQEPTGPTDEPKIVLRLNVDNGEVLFDNITVCKQEGDSNPTIFLDRTVDLFKDMNVGILRALQMGGNSVSNTIYGGLHNYAKLNNIWGDAGPRGDADKYDYGMHDWFELCEEVGADPWYSLPGTIYPEEIDVFMEYIGGDTNTTWGAVRAELGHPDPWTNVFDKIYVEIGNEAWNTYGGFKVGGYNGPDYWEELFGRVKTSSLYTPKLVCMAGGQAAGPPKGEEILGWTTNCDSFAIGPYIRDWLHTNDLVLNPVENNQLLRWNFAETYQRVDDDDLNGYGDILQTAGKEMAVYEVNFHTTHIDEHSASLEVRNGLVTSLGGALALANANLETLKIHGARALCQFNTFGELIAVDTQKGTGGERLWGMVLSTRTNKPVRMRPQALLMKAGNQVIGGELLSTYHTGENPTCTVTGRFDTTSSTFTPQEYTYEEIRSYAFKEGDRRGLILINYNLDEYKGVDVRFPEHVLNNRASSWLVSSDSPTNNNEFEVGDTLPVTITTGTVNGFTNGAQVVMPPCSMQVLEWNANGFLSRMEFSTNLVTVNERSTGDFKVRLQDDPGGTRTVQMSLVNADEDLDIYGSTTLNFNSINYTNWQTVTLTAAADGDLLNGTGDIRLETDEGLIEHLSVVENDGDSAIEVSVSEVSVPENSMNTFNVRLASIPGYSVTVPVARVSGDSNITVTSSASLTFTTITWDEWQTVTLHAADDSDYHNDTATILCGTAGTAMTNSVIARELDDELSYATFQEDVYPSGSYVGCDDAYIFANEVGNNYGTVSTLRLKSSASGERNTLIRWDISSLPSGALLETATLEFNISAPQAGTAAIHQSKRNWTELGATFATYNGTDAWQTAGGTGVFDRGADLLGSFDTSISGVVEAHLSAAGVAYVGDWITTPSTNNGFILTTDGGSTMTFASSEASTETQHPKLTIGYYVPPTLEIVASTNAISVAEGSNNTFGVKLSIQPAGSTTVTVAKAAGGDEHITVTDGSNLVFSTINWNSNQTVTISAATDPDTTDGWATIECSSPGIATNSVMATEVDDDEPIEEITSNARVLFDFGRVEGPTAGNWNNITTPTNVAMVITNAVDENGDVTSIDLSITNGFQSGIQQQGSTAAMLYPASAEYDGFRVNGTVPTAALKLSGMATNATCELIFFASDTVATDTRYIVTGASVVTGILYEAEIEGPNETNTVTLSVRPDVNGEIVIDIDRNGNGTGEGHLGVLDLSIVGDPIDILVSTNAVAVPEGSTNTFGVKLARVPGLSVTVTVAHASGDSDITVTGGSNLVFSSANWSNYLPVTLSAAEDDGEALIGGATILCSAAGQNSATVTVTEVDNDSLGTYLFAGTGEAGDSRTPHDEGTAVSNVTFSTFGRTNVLYESGHDGEYCSESWSNSSTVVKSNYISFTVTVDSDYELTLDQVVFDSWADAWRGQNYCRIEVFRSGTSMEESSDLTVGTWATNTFNFTDFTALSSQTVEFRIYAWDDNGWDNNDYFVVDNVAVYGFLTPTGGVSRSMAMSGLFSAGSVGAGEVFMSVDTLIKPLLAGNNLIGVSLEAENLAALLGSQLLPGDRIVLYNANESIYEVYSPADALVLTIPAGGAFWLETGTARDLTLTGARLASKPLVLLEGLQIIANPVAEDAELQALGLNGSTSANPGLCDKVSVLVDGAYQVYGLGADGIWYKVGDKKIWRQKVESKETIEAGEGFWYDAQKPFIWNAE